MRRPALAPPWPTALVACLLCFGCDDSAAADPADAGPRVDATADAIPLDATLTDATLTDGRPADAMRDAAPDAIPDTIPDTIADAAPDAFTDGVPPGPPLPAPPGPAMAEGRRVATSPICAECHANSPDADAMRDAAGAPIAPFDLWQATMMANSARDPLWRAVVSAEIAATPAARAAIEAKCMRCHAPMASIEAAESGGRPTLALLAEASAEGHLARDGVSCTACHGITADGLGDDRSFTGGYVIDDRRRLFGPHEGVNPMPMMRWTDFEPVAAAHTTTSALCGACHTLITDALTPAGAPTGHTLVEQATYLEWRASRFADEGITCQRCHMPSTEPDGRPVSTAIARNPGGFDFPFADDRSPYGRHLFVGANVLIPAILRDNADALRPQADRAAFDAVIGAARALLGEAARLEVGAEREGERLRVRVGVDNRAGHKLPSGFPSRRVWLSVEVRGPAGVVFRSGGFDDRGRLVDRAGRVLAGERAGGPLVEVGFAIDADDRVALFESVMCDPDGRPTWTLLRGARFCRDTRIPPRGWRADRPDAARTAPAGLAAGEAFGDGRAEVTYTVDAPAAGGPYTVEVGLHHQTLGARFAAELFTVDTPEIRAFRGFYAAADARPSTLATARVEAR